MGFYGRQRNNKKDILENTKKEFAELTSAIEDGIKILLIIGSKISQKTYDIKTKKSLVSVFFKNLKMIDLYKSCHI